MPKKPVDYSKTKIYKIACKDPSIKDVYVGSTTDVVNRRSAHKTSCNNEKVKGHNFAVYVFIRAHGCWDNWDLIVVEAFPCETNEQQRTRERFWFETLGATLNTNTPIVTPEEEKIKNRKYNKRENVQANQLQWRLDNRQEICEKSRARYAEHQEEERERSRLKRLNPHYMERRSAREKQRVICECGIEVCRAAMNKHKKGTPHIEAMKLK